MSKSNRLDEVIDKLFSKYCSKAQKMEANILKEISIKVTRKWVESNKTRKEFAKTIGINKRQLDKWINGNYNFSIKSLSSMCEKLGLECSISIEDKGE